MSVKFPTPITIGADPELFVMREDKFVSGHDMLPGNKYDPFRVKDGAVQVDGTALEFNIDPCSTANEFVKRIDGVVTIMKRMVHHVSPSYRVVAAPTALYTDDYWKTVPESAKILGCEPDYDAWTGEVNPKPNDAVSFRTGSGHIHIGWTEDEDPHDVNHFSDCIRVVKQMDCILYPVSFLWDNDRKRRELYGKPGAFRPKPYGAEYRVLSNAWVSDPDVQEWIFNATQHGMALLDERKFLWKSPYAVDSANKEEFTEKELRHYHGYLRSQGFPALPDSVLPSRVQATVA
jgi:hypothetical protein